MSKTHIAWLSPTIGILRIHEDANKIPGKWTWCCVIERIGNDAAKIHAVQRVPNREEGVEIRTALTALGIDQVEWDRYKSSGQVKNIKCHKNLPNV